MTQACKVLATSGIHLATVTQSPARLGKPDLLLSAVPMWWLQEVLVPLDQAQRLGWGVDLFQAAWLDQSRPT